jgi:hypothetical protein
MKRERLQLSPYKYKRPEEGLGNGKSENFLRTGTRQGCLLLPFLFSIVLAS